MKSFSLSRIALLGTVAALASGSVYADSMIDFGKRLYDSNCASCHGLTGKGDGPIKDYLSVKPTDLTLIAKKNNGVLPVERLNEVIDGRKIIGTHGSREMPVWGQDFSSKVGTNWSTHMDAPFDPEVFVRGRIMALVDYIARMQDK